MRPADLALAALAVTLAAGLCLALAWGWLATGRDCPGMAPSHIGWCA